MNVPSSRAPSSTPRGRGFGRVARVAATVQKALAGPVDALVRNELGTLATVTAVEVSPDLRHGLVHLSIYGSPEQALTCVRTLNDRAAELQRVVAGALRTKRTPVLRFKLDEGVARADRITRLLQGTGEGAAPPA